MAHCISMAHCKAPFTLLLFCFDVFLLHQNYPFTLLRFCTKRREKHPFMCVHIDLPDNKYGAKDIRFVLSHCSRFVRPRSHCSVFVQKLRGSHIRFCEVFTLIRTKTPQKRRCSKRYQKWISTKNEAFEGALAQCERTKTEVF